MQLAPLDSGSQVAHRTSTDRAAITGVTPPPDVASPPQPVALSATRVRAGFKVGDPGFNRRVAGAQQALEYLDRLGADLHDIRKALRGRLASAQAAGGAASVDARGETLEARIQHFRESWQRRASATAGTLDSQLKFDAEGRGRRAFSVRGLDMASLRSGGPEMLSFSVGGRGPRTASSVAVEPGLTDEAIVRRFDRALAPSGIRAARGAQGELSFSVAETAWPAVLDLLAVRGEGQRFPTGRFSQVRIEPEQDAIRPADWKTHDVAALRATRERVFVAEGLVRHARHAVSRALTDIASSLQLSGSAREVAERGGWSAAFARSFEDVTGSANFQAMAALLPAVSGISRGRVTVLLSLPPG